jgi:hypothetical protein
VFRTSDMILIAAMVSAAAFTYATKHSAEDRLDLVRKLEADIRYEQDSITVLKADWSLLTQPSRLKRLAEVYHDELQLQPVAPTQIGSLEELPEKPLRIEDLTREALGGGVDSSVTSAVVQ